MMVLPHRPSTTLQQQRCRRSVRSTWQRLAAFVLLRRAQTEDDLLGGRLSAEQRVGASGVRRARRAAGGRSPTSLPPPDSTQDEAIVEARLRSIAAVAGVVGASLHDPFREHTEGYHAVQRANRESPGATTTLRHTNEVFDTLSLLPFVAFNEGFLSPHSDAAKARSSRHVLVVVNLGRGALRATCTSLCVPYSLLYSPTMCTRHA